MSEKREKSEPEREVIKYSTLTDTLPGVPPPPPPDVDEDEDP